MKTPAECTSLADVRKEIDRLDADLLRLLAVRGEYVLRAAGFKPTIDAVVDPERIESMIAIRRQTALEQGLKPDMVESLYRFLIDYYIGEEREHIQSTRTTG